MIETISFLSVSAQFFECIVEKIYSPKGFENILKTNIKKFPFQTKNPTCGGVGFY